MRLRTADLAKLNSLTQYPSIPTYHALDPATGGLTPHAEPFFGEVVLTEKVDGTNGRIVLLPSGEWLIGSREEFLTARGDIVYNTKFGLVDVVRPIAEKLLAQVPLGSDTMVTFYVEVFGGNIGQYAKNYTTSKETFGVRLFDVAYTTYLNDKMSWDREKISSWRQHGGQEFATEWSLETISKMYGVPRVPVLATLRSGELPYGIEDMHAFVQKMLPTSLVALDETARKRPEGLVLRTFDRSTIAKARLQNYERTMKLREETERRLSR